MGLRTGAFEEWDFAEEQQEEHEHHYRNLTVEDAVEPGEGSAANPTTEAAPEAEKKEVVKAPASGPVAKEKAKYWVTERSVGEFHHSFSFSFLVALDQEAVKASLKNGVLSAVAPKKEKARPRRIVVEQMNTSMMNGGKFGPSLFAFHTLSCGFLTMTHNIVDGV